jgi:hypothetical protein
MPLTIKQHDCIGYLSSIIDQTKFIQNAIRSDVEIPDSIAKYIQELHMMVASLQEMNRNR